LLPAPLLLPAVIGNAGGQGQTARGKSVSGVGEGGGRAALSLLLLDLHAVAKEGVVDDMGTGRGTKAGAKNGSISFSKGLICQSRSECHAFSQELAGSSSLSQHLHRTGRGTEAGAIASIFTRTQPRLPSVCQDLCTMPACNTGRLLTLEPALAKAQVRQERVQHNR